MTTAQHHFERQLALIHGFDTESRLQPLAGGAMDIRHAEFTAMVHAFLGPDFDRTKVDQVEALQVEMRDRQAKLHKELETKKIGPEQFFDATDDLFRRTFAQCEQILGRDSFTRLFGPTSYKGILDRTTFLSQFPK